ncbi:MAG TPA: DUF5682 family protein, partial [Candidatus Kapabacteria bacterium]|nr:DUF5682 family protein [Candidatus Kapabacteria bacterium]
MATHILGIRHHGPGSARHVVDALKQVNPDIILIEGPPEAEAILSWAKSPQMKPPVAILVYVPDNPHRAVFYPFVEYSPEWQAIQFGLQNNIPIRFADMPLTHSMGLRQNSVGEDVVSDHEEESTHYKINNEDKSSGSIQEDSSEVFYGNPIQYLANIAGYEDGEQWWEQHFELSREDPLLLFETIKKAMKVLREKSFQDIKINDLQREVFMRRAITKARNEKYDSIAFICGAWHAPALEETYKPSVEKELIKDLPKIKVDTTWIPWTNDRLMFENGYGAGIGSPGWYQHQWNQPNDDGTFWLTKTAHVFRKENIDISSAHIIEAVKLVKALCMIRNLNKPGLNEMQEATRTVMLMGDSLPMILLKKELYVGNNIGQIPDEAPKSPLQLDFDKKIRYLRLKLSEEEQIITLDLRKPLDIQKSMFLNQLNLLNINWGELITTQSKGTFKEQWRLYWQPQMMIELIAKSSFGNTIKQACFFYIKEIINKDIDIVSLSQLLQKSIASDIHESIDTLLKKMDEVSANSVDVKALMQTLLPLVDVLKYGDVRKTNQEKVKVILDVIFYRLLINLSVNCMNIDYDQAVETVQLILQCNKALLMLDNPDYLNEWYNQIKFMCENSSVHPYILGSCHKLAYENNVLDKNQIAKSFSQALSLNNIAEYSV